MKNFQEKKDTRIIDSFIKRGWLYVIVALLFPAFGAVAQTQDNMQKKNTKQDTTRTKTMKTKTTTDTTRTYKYNQQDQKMDQNQNQNQQNRNRYDNQKGDTLQMNKSRDAVLIEDNPKK